MAFRHSPYKISNIPVGPYQIPRTHVYFQVDTLKEGKRYGAKFSQVGGQLLAEIIEDESGPLVSQTTSKPGSYRRRLVFTAPNDWPIFGESDATFRADTLTFSVDASRLRPYRKRHVRRRTRVQLKEAGALGYRHTTKEQSRPEVPTAQNGRAERIASARDLLNAEKDQLGKDMSIWIEPNGKLEVLLLMRPVANSKFSET